MSDHKLVFHHPMGRYPTELDFDTVLDAHIYLGRLAERHNLRLDGSTLHYKLLLVREGHETTIVEYQPTRRIHA